MKTSDVLTRLTQLEAKIDPLLFKKKMEDNDENGGLLAPAVGAGVGVGAVGGGLLAHRAIMKNYGGEGGVEQAYKNVGRNIKRSVGDYAGAVSAAAEGGPQLTLGSMKQGVAGAVKPYASKAAEHVATGVTAAKTGALTVIEKLKKKMPMLVPHLAKIGLRQHFNGRLVELDAHLDSFLEAHREQQRKRTLTKVAALGVGAAATAAGGVALGVAAHRAAVGTGGGRAGKVILGSISTLRKAVRA